jgi:hypothetical protein
VQTTELGQDSLDLGSVFFYDLILLDLNLPDMSGYDANRVFGPLRRIPRHPRDFATWLERSLVSVRRRASVLGRHSPGPKWGFPREPPMP